MSDNDPSPGPTEIGRRTLRGLTIALAVDVLLLIVTTIVAMAFDIGGPDFWLAGLLIAFVLLVLMLLVGPGVAFLIHSVRYRDTGATLRLRRSATASAIAPGLAGLALLLTDPDTRLFGWVLIGVSAAILARAWTAREAESTLEDSFVRYGYSVVGLAFVLLSVWGRPHPHTPPYLTAMKSDLRNLVSVQEEYFSEHQHYTTNLAALDFRSSTDVSPPKIVVGPNWWRATTTHNRLPKVTCGIAINTRNPVRDTISGTPVCR